jgi:hypothetical protein
VGCRDLVALGLDVRRPTLHDGIGVHVCVDEMQETDRALLAA